MNTSIFHHSFSDPFKEDVIELGEIGWESVLEKFDNVQWPAYLERMEKSNKSDVFHSPALTFENKGTAHELSVSAVGNASAYEFNILYKRPKEVQRFFGLVKRYEKEYLSEVSGQTRSDVLKVLQAFISRNYRYLDDRIK